MTRPTERSLKRRFAWTAAAIVGTAASVVACSDSANSLAGPGPGPTTNQQPASAPERRVYVANLSAANGSGASGTARFVLDETRIGVVLEATGLDPSLRHMQHIHSGTKCAGPEADANSDGYVDPAEAEPSSGRPIVPLSLDAELRAASEGAELFPLASAAGKVLYVQSIAIAGFLDSLRGGELPATRPSASVTIFPDPIVSPMASASPSDVPSPSPSDEPDDSPSASPSVTASASPSPNATGGDLAALGDELEGHVIEIHGVSADTDLPATVQGTAGRPAHETLPVACGVITRVTEE